MNDDILYKLINKLIEDTKTRKIKWVKSEMTGRYFQMNDSIQTTEFNTTITEIGNIYIGKNDFSDKMKLYITEKTTEELSYFTGIIDYNSNYYIELLRLYNLIESSYIKIETRNRIERAIDAYIHRID